MNSRGTVCGRTPERRWNAAFDFHGCGNAHKKKLQRGLTAVLLFELEGATAPLHGIEANAQNEQKKPDTKAMAADGKGRAVK